MKNVFLMALVSISSASAQADLFDVYSYDAAAAAYGSTLGIQPSDTQVTGSHKLIATSSKSYRGDFVKKDLNGLTNADGSMPLLTLVVNGSDMQVTWENLGTRAQTQGPSVAVYDTVNGVMSFAQYSYRAGRLNDDVYFVSECRMMPDNVRILCAKRFIVNRPEAVNDQQRALHNQIVGYDLYNRR